MHTEIERKFLVTNDTWRAQSTATEFCQGYIFSDAQCLVRVRIEGEQSFLTIKGPKDGIARPEFEYAIPQDEAEQLLKNLAHKPLIRKIRHTLQVGQHLWEIDEFCDDNTGLILAEIELKEKHEGFEKPQWLGKEVTFDARYRHASLAKMPFSTWQLKEKDEVL